MMISTKGRYALRVLCELSTAYGDGYASLRDIAHSQSISVKYLESIMSGLFRAGIVDSRRGRLGGYRLARRARDISVFSVFDAVEDSVSAVACLDHDGILCGREEHCAGYPLWVSLQEVIDTYLKSVTLEDIINGSYSHAREVFRESLC